MFTIIMSSPRGVDILFLLFPPSVAQRPSRLVSGHFKEKYLSYLYQIWYGCLLGLLACMGLLLVKIAL